MLQNIRDNVQGTLAKIIIALIAIPFVLFGIESLFSIGSTKNKAAEVNGETISKQELNEAVFLRKKQLIAQMGDKLDPSQLEDSRLLEPALNGLIERKLMLQSAAALKMGVSEQQIGRIIADNPDFQENGHFSNERFRAVLASANLTQEMFKRLYKADLLLNQYSDGLVSTAFMTDAEIAVDAKFTHQTRDIRYIKLQLDQFTKSVETTPEAIKAFYDAHPERFQSEESAVVEYLELSLQDFMKDISADELQAAYNEEVANFTPETTREVAHILIELNADTSTEQAAAKLKDVQAKLAAGESFAELAKQYSDDLGSKEFGGNLGQLNKDAFPAAFVAAAEKLEQGQVSDIVESDAGLHLIKLVNLTTTHPKTFAERKTALEQSLKLAKAEPAFWAAVEELKDISFNAPDLQEPATALKLQVKTSAPVGRNGGTDIFSNPSVYKTVFTDAVMKDHANSDVIDAGENHVVVLRLKQYNPVVLQPFAEVEAEAKAAYIREQAGQALDQKMAEVAKALQEGADVEQLAKAQKLTWELVLGAQRTSNKTAPAIIKAAFKLPRPAAEQRAIDTVKLDSGDQAIVVVTNVKDGDQFDINGAEAKAMRNFISRTRAIEQFQAVQNQLRENAEIERF